MKNRHHGLLVATSLLALATGAAQAATDNTPPGLSLAHDGGVADPAQTITITVQLKLADPDLFKKTVDALYDPYSPTFHKWLTDADLKRFAPAAEQMASVRAELERQGLTVISVQKNGFSLRARGALGDVARAFNTEIHTFSRNGKTFRANTRNASLSGPAAAYVAAVAGLESHTVRPMLTHGINLATGKPYASTPADAVEQAGGLRSLITDQILSPAQTVNFTTPGSPLPTATYTGVVYGDTGALVPDYTPHQLQRVYGLDQAYKQGLDGTGQTIVLLEGFGYPTAKSDANRFSKLAGLPPLTAANFRVIYPEGKPVDPKAGIIEGWNDEIALDIDWAHSIAPGARIAVVASNGQGNEDFQAAMQFIIDNNVGYAVSDSWETDIDIISGPSEQESFENVLILAAAKGISFQFSTGDSGDGGLGTPVGAAGVPSVSPHAVAVGGTAIFNTPGSKGHYTTGWGDSDVVLDNVTIFDPPLPPRFLVGGGGGESVFWPKPAWQSALPGVHRQTPDISALADSFTGVPIVVTSGSQQVVGLGIGGTSLSSPIFTAFWAIAQQKAGHPLGQASPTIAGLKSGVVDVLPASSPDNITGSITDANGTTDYTAKMLFAGAYNHNQSFLATLYPLPQSSAAVSLGFGLDSSFTVTPGWDNATGFGTPDGLNFINAAAAFGTK